jgi:protein-S-isoprenylcysteine O-methyltransferase Ste14
MTPLRTLARWRVPLGFVCSALALGLARPTMTSVAIGAILAALGEGVRVWGAGHLEKSRIVTRSGPYRLVGHPLYLGSALLGAGFAAASRSLPVAVLAGAYLATTLTAAIRTEEAFMRVRFGSDYDAYRRGQVDEVTRFDWGRVMRNREHRTVAGVAAVLALLAAKAWMAR